MIRGNFSSNNSPEVIILAKKGMKRYFPKHEKNEVSPVPQMSGKVKSGKAKAKPVISGETVPFIRSYHAVPFINMNEIPPVFGGVDNDLANENLANDFDMTAADKEDFRKYRE